MLKRSFLIALLILPVFLNMGAKTGSSFKQMFSANCFYLGIGGGAPLPLGYAGSVLNPGILASLSFGRQFAAGPARFKLGIESGFILESTLTNNPGVDLYTSWCIPLDAMLAADLQIAGPFYCYIEALGGYCATLVYYASSSIPPLGVLKPLVSAGLGTGFDLGNAFTVQLGARFTCVFYDGNALLFLSPGLWLGTRF